MGDAVRRVQKHLQELSRDNLTSVEDRHHANLGWLQVSLQQLCKQIEVDVRVELTRPPRLSFSKPLVAPLLANDEDKPPQRERTSQTRPEPVKTKATTRLEFDAVADEEQDHTASRDSRKQREKEEKQTPVGEPPVREEKETKKKKTKMVTKTRKVMKPKKIVTKVKTLVKKPKAELPKIDVGALKVVDLKSELKKRGLKQTGVKAVLVSRLQEALDAEDAEVEEEEVEEEVEIVEEIIEEVDEEYEEEVEITEQSDESVVLDAADEVEVIVVDDDEDSPQPKASHKEKLPKTKHTQKDLASEREAARMSMEDVDVAKMEAGSDTLGTENATQDMQIDSGKAASGNSSPKKSLSDMVSPPSSDEVVRESDLGGDDLMSPEAKAFAASVVSAQKSPAKSKASTAAAVVVKDNAVKPHAQQKTEATVLTKSLAAAKADKPVVETTVKLQGSKSDSSASSDSSAQAKHQIVTSESAVTEKSDSTLAVKKDAAKSESAEKIVTDESSVRSKPQSAAAALSSSVLAKTMAATDRALKAAAAAAAAAADQAAKAATVTHAPGSAPGSAPTVTPAREILARLKSMTPGASSDRSSSVSSYTASRRYTGSTNFVEDSQPDQSPHPHVTFATDFTSSSTRAASASQLEIQAIAAKMKTPDSASGAQPASERVSHSEPRVNTVKPPVVDEAERKRQEQQENIQREAQRLRMAAKQSARKRFEEAKSTNLLLAKRDQISTGVSAPSSSTTQRSSSANSSTPVTPTETISSTPSSSASSMGTSALSGEKAEMKTAVNDSVAVEGTKSSAPAAPAVKSSQAENAKRSAPPTAAVPAKKEPESTKRVLQSRKRSSIAIDTSTSTLYPSKKRASISRAKDVAADVPVAKRTSLMKEKPSEVTRKRTSRDAPVVEATKRRRSSESRDKLAPVSTTSKRTSITSETSTKSTSRTIPTAAVSRTTAMSRRDSASSTISSSSNISTSESRSKPSAMAGGAVRKPANLVSGLHSFTSLLEKDSANLSSSQGSNTSSSSRAPAVSALKMAEKSRLLEQKKNLEKAKRKEALAKRYEEQRKADEEKRKKYAQMKEKAERDARLKREQDQATEKKQRDLELAKKRQQRLQEMRSGMEKKKVPGSEKDPAPAVAKAAPVSRVAASTSSTASTSSATSIQPTKSGAGKGAASKEVTTYAMSEHEESESEASDDDADTKRNDKNIPKWAQREHLERTLKSQFGPNAVDPTPSIFPDFVDSCDLEAIFEPTDVRKKKRFQRRTSSGNWLADRPTAREKAIYKRDMGFQR